MLVLPFGFLAPAAGGANLIPVEGYDAYLDFGESSTITLDGNSNIETIADLSGNGYDATQSTSGARPGWTNAGRSNYYYTGSTTTWLPWDSADGICANADFASNPYTIICAINEDSQRRQPWALGGLGAGSTNRRLEFFMNDSAGRRDLIAYNRQVFTTSTNNASKDIILFGQSNSSNATIYAYKNTMTSGTNTTNWQSDTVGCSSWIGNTARDNRNTTDNWRGKIYFIAVYPFLLDSTERESIRDWAVAKWGLDLT